MNTLSALFFVFLRVSTSSCQTYQEVDYNVNLLNENLQISLKEQEEVDYYVELINENVQKSLNYILPTFHEEFQLQDESQKPLNFGLFDFVIVGGGTAGSLLANRLSEVDEWSILLLEAGGKRNDFVDIPGASSFLLNSQFNWGFNTTSQRNTCRGQWKGMCKSPSGKGLGGSTLINDNIFSRGYYLDYDKWAEAGLEGWSYNDILPYLMKYENATSLSNIDKELHGVSGELKLENYHILSDLAEAYIQILESGGYNMTDYNGYNPLGYGICQQSTYIGKRQSGSAAFIDPITDRTNLKVVTSSFVTKLLIPESECEGVQFIYNNTLYTASVNKEVILSAGAIGSAKILMLSGIGPTEELGSLDISSVIDLPVGQFYQDHCVAGAIATTNYSQSTSLENEVFRYLNSTGYLSSSARANIYTFHDMKSFPTMELIYLDGLGLKFINNSLNYLDPYVIGLFNALLHPKSFGTIKLSSKDPLEFPLIDPNCLAEPEDLEALIEALDLSVSILLSEPFKRFNVTPNVDTTFCGNFTFGTWDYWKCFILYNGFQANHGVGSCRMGTSSFDSVVNERLTVHGLDNVRVIDAGVVPYPVTGHLFATVYMVAEKGADMIKDDHLVISIPLSENKANRYNPFGPLFFTFLWLVPRFFR